MPLPTPSPSTPFRPRRSTASWPAKARELPASSGPPASRPPPGRCSPPRARAACRCVLFGLGKELDRPPLLPGRLGHRASRRRLPPCRRLPRRQPRHPRLCPRRLSLHPLPRARPRRAPGDPRRRRQRPHHPHRRRRLSRPRPDQHAGQRHGPGRARHRGRGPRRPPRRHRHGDAGRCARRRLSPDPRRRRGGDTGARPAPHRPHLGRSIRAEGHAGRQGRLLRHRRARHQAVLRRCSS